MVHVSAEIRNEHLLNISVSRLIQSFLTSPAILQSSAAPRDLILAASVGLYFCLVRVHHSDPYTNVSIDIN
jgi:hypothetical protein